MRLFRASAVVLLLLNHIAIALIARLFIRDQNMRRRFFLSKATNYSRHFFRLLNMEVHVENAQNIHPKQNYLWLANHMSYLDALILASIRPVCFVTSIEMKEMPVLGLLTELGGCLYTERRSKENLRKEVNQLSQALRDGFDIAIFPEGTSTDGSGILPFKRGLVTSCIEAEKNILPLVIEYQDINGTRVNTGNRDLLCWYGKMSFAPHFLKLIFLKSVRISLRILPELQVTKDSSRDTLVAAAFEAINSNYKVIQE